MSDVLTAALPPGARLRSELDLGKMWPPFLVWLAVTGCTLGLGWIVVSGQFFKLIINSTCIVDARGAVLGRFHCDYDMEPRLPQIVLWIVISIFTLGIGLLFYSFRAARGALQATEVEWT